VPMGDSVDQDSNSRRDKKLPLSPRNGYLEVPK
jgi:hypothetical protein